MDELVGWHVAKIGDRWAALEPLRQGVRHALGRFVRDVARGLRIRCDWGPQYISRTVMAGGQLRFSDHHPDSVGDTLAKRTASTERKRTVSMQSWSSG